MKKFLVFLIILILCSCATQSRAKIHTQKQGLMILKNTDMGINKKYYKQKKFKPSKTYKRK